jgi:hypothetical protein
MTGIHWAGDNERAPKTAEQLAAGQVIRFGAGSLRTVVSVAPDEPTADLIPQVKLTSRVHGTTVPVSVTVPAAEEFRVLGTEYES